MIVVLKSDLFFMFVDKYFDIFHFEDKNLRKILLRKI